MSDVKLNAAQRRAVEHGEGPLLIVAGAGTGKTRVIIERVGHLLRSVPGLQPENILALTFANKAAEEMRQRATERFGEAARRCRFSTFHSFCYALLAEARPSRPLDKIDQWIFLRRNLEALELNYYFKVSEPGRFLADLVEFCSRCHDNLVTPEEYAAYVEELAARRAAQGAGGNAAESDEELARQQEVARVFALLERMQQEQGLLSFGAMISRAVRLLDASPELLRQLQERYPYILVDEFQDTNTAQFELLVRLAGARRNLTVVGDDDQAIYRFRGASFASFQQFAERFPDHARVVLDRNYRSTRKILSIAGAAIAANSQDRYLPEKKLVTDNDAGPGVEVWEFSDDAGQAEYAAQHIAESVEQGRAERYDEFAILYRAHHHRDRLVEALRRRGIPFAIRNLSINNLPLTRDMLALLRIIGDSSDSVSLLRVLAEPRWQLSAEQACRYCREAAARRQTLLETVAQGTPSQPLWEQRKQFLELRQRFQTLAAQQRLSAWFPLLAAEMGWPRSAEERPAYRAFLRFLRTWDQEKSATGRLQEFLEYFGYFEEAGGTIPLEEPQSFSDAGTQPELWPDLREEANAEEDSRNGRGKVQLMSVHAAKGLEFDRVIVWHLVRRAFPTVHRRPLIELPPELWKGPLPRGDFHLEEERRLFYVALTRARRMLVLSTVANARQKPSVFLEQLQEIPPPLLLRKRPVKVPAPKPPDIAEPAAPPADAGARLAEWFCRPLAPDAEMTLSISQIEMYEQCPLKYHFSQHWRIPVAVPAPLHFGTIVHAALKEVTALAASCPAGIGAEHIREILDRHWPEAGFPDPVQERKYREMALEQLAGVARNWAAERIVLLYQEKSFELRAAGCRLVGRIDQVHRRRGGTVELVEYKTGRPQSRKEADRSRQITLYAQACRQELGVEPDALILYNLTNQEAIRTRRAPEDFQELEQTIRETTRQIQAGRFPAQPGYHCNFCSYQAICPAQEERYGQPPPLAT